MSGRGEELARGASLQLEEIIAFLQGLQEEDLEQPDPRRPAKMLADAAAHMAEGYHHLARLLEAQVFAREPLDARHGHGRPPTTDLDGIIDRAVEARNAVARIADLADDQLGRVPPARTSRFSDGRRTIAEIIEAVIAHQAEHLGELRSAVRGPAAAPADGPE